MIRLFTGIFHCQGWCCAFPSPRLFLQLKGISFHSIRSPNSQEIPQKYPSNFSWHRNASVFCEFSGRNFHHFILLGAKVFFVCVAIARGDVNSRTNGKFSGFSFINLELFLELGFRLGSRPKSWLVFLTNYPEMGNRAPKLSNAVHPRLKNDFLVAIFFLPRVKLRDESRQHLPFSCFVSCAMEAFSSMNVSELLRQPFPWFLFLVGKYSLVK